MEIKVKEVTDVTEEKSKAEIEQELLEKHEEKFEDSKQPETNEETTEAPVAEETKEEVKEETPSSELNDEDVLSYIKNRYDKEINSVDDLFAQKEVNEELPEDVSQSRSLANKESSSIVS